MVVFLKQQWFLPLCFAVLSCFGPLTFAVFPLHPDEG
ncbi:hypothetical protein Patl1_10409 [Pistacia atlantica]|uniref:Uncharacterized protein n=1 Tax=Pistacia atlantica TaxID=434234 RepID=A0ACC1A3Y8_9ROSI|nr:hypothetical protein Patl1_10409 [Pistacia atlantica]